MADQGTGGQSAASPSVIVKVIEHTRTRQEKQVKTQLIGDVALLFVRENMPTISDPSGKTTANSRPERAPTVVRVISPSEALDPTTDERVIKRQRIGNVLLEMMSSSLPSA